MAGLGHDCSFLIAGRVRGAVGGGGGSDGERERPGAGPRTVPSWSSAMSLRRLACALSNSQLAPLIVRLGDREPSGGGAADGGAGGGAERGGVGGGGVEEESGGVGVGVVRAAAAASRECVAEGGLDRPVDRLRGFGLDTISRSDGGEGGRKEWNGMGRNRGDAVIIRDAIHAM